MSELPDQPCIEFVEQVTDYLEDAVPPDHRAIIEAHLEICGGCRTLIDQWNETIRLAGRLADTDTTDLDPATRTRLITTFRQSHQP
jgi:predicted anti-sigma-YlaC factor YlaD